MATKRKTSGPRSQGTVYQNSPDEIRRAKIYETNYRAWAPLLAEGTGGWVLREGDIHLQARPVWNWINGSLYTPWKVQDIPARLQRALELYQVTGQGMGVITSPSSHLLALRRAVLDIGFQCFYHIPFMHLELKQTHMPKKPVRGIRLEQVQDFTGFREYAHPWIGKATTKPRRLLFALMDRLAKEKKPKLLHFLAMDGELPVASTVLFLHRHTVGVYDVATLPSHRRRGIGHMVLAEACRFARELGYEEAGLGSSGPGVGLYLKTGFTQAGYYGSYFMGKGRIQRLDTRVEPKPTRRKLGKPPPHLGID